MTRPTAPHLLAVPQAAPPPVAKRTPAAALQMAFSRLRGLETVQTVMDRGAEEAVRTLGFDRALMFRVRGSHLVAERAIDDRDPAWAKRILDLARSNPAILDHQLVETEMIRRRTPVLVSDPATDPTTIRALVEVTQTTGYVAAPIMPQGRVIGFIHADRHYADRDVDAGDRDLLWAYAEGLGFALERAGLQERLQAQRRQIRQLVSTTEAVTSELSDTEFELGRVDAASGSLIQSAASIFVAPESRLHHLLTAREIEVLGLMASGSTNGGIAQRLVISEATVKSHVKHILRKLRASNRAEAVWRYMNLTGTREPEDRPDSQ